MDDLLAYFLTETHEGLLVLDTALVRLERSPGDAATLAEVFRLVHTIKGTCGFLGLPRLEAVVHAAESVLGRYRDATLAVTPDGISRLLQALDSIRGILQALEATGAEPAGTDAVVIAALDALAGDPAHSGAAATATTASDRASAAAPETIRVPVDVLERLKLLVAELVLTRNQLLQLARGTADAAYAVPLRRLSHVTAELQEAVMKTRMQPIGQVWAKLPRLVRDLGIDLGKRIELELCGAEIEFDRQVLELIRDPLIHMVRNSGDHGLETPRERRLAGKPEAGTIRLQASHQGDHVLIEIGDDGRGLNLDRIRGEALAQGLATKAELLAMPACDIQRFIFRAGFSTATAITAVSGRGVGMDVVRANLERLGGTVEVRSREGKGTTFVLLVPLTLAKSAVQAAAPTAMARR